MLIISLVLAVIGLAALVFAVITSNELIAWVCIAASMLGVVLLIIDALQERQRRAAGTTTHESEGPQSDADEGAAEYPGDALDESDETSTHEESDIAAGDSVSDDQNTR